MSLPETLKTLDEVIALFLRRHFQPPAGIRPSGLLEWCRDGESIVERLAAAVEEAASGPELLEVSSRWRRLDDHLKVLTHLDNDVHFPGFVEHACSTWWDTMTKAQLRIGCTVGQAYRAMPAYILAMLAFRQRDRGTAMRWASLGYIADLLEGIVEGGGNDATLRFGLGASPETIMLLRNASTSPDEGTAHTVENLPEWRFTRAVAQAGGLALVAPSMRYSHHASVPFVDAAVRYALDEDSSSNNEQGKRLESVVAFLTTTVPGMRPRLRLKTVDQSAEHDVIATAVGDSPYPLPERASEWLIECKNMDTRATVNVIGHFLAKMLRAGSRFGLLVAAEGITRGKSEDMHAEAFRRDFCLRHQVFCLVVGANELRALGAGGTFRGLIDQKYESDRFGASLFE